MRQRHAGRIVNISSIGGKVSTPHLLPYSASKFALTGLSEVDTLRSKRGADSSFIESTYPSRFSPTKIEVNSPEALPVSSTEVKASPALPNPKLRILIPAL